MYRFLILLPLLLLTTGCGGSANLAPVAGTVTLDGQPLADTEVIFSPIATESNPNPGPFSVGQTDATGRFVLKTRNGENGAVVGKHRVGIGGNNEDVDADLAGAKAVDEAYKQNPSVTEKEIAKIERDAVIAAKALAGKVPAKYNKQTTLEFEVTKAGTDAANFELTTK